MTDKERGAESADKGQAKPDSSGDAAKTAAKDDKAPSAQPQAAKKADAKSGADPKAAAQPAAPQPAAKTATASAATTSAATASKPAADKSATGKPTDDKKPAATTVAKPTPAKKGGAWKWPFIGGAVIGVAVLAAGAVGAVATRTYWLPYLPVPQTADQVDPAAFAAVEGRVEDLEAAPVAAEVTELRGDLEALGAEVEALSGRLAAAESGSDDAAARAAQQAAFEDGLKGLEDKLSGLNRRLDSLASEPSAPVIGLEARIAELEARIGGAAAAGAEPEAVQRLTRAFADLEGRLAARESDAGVLTDLTTQLAALEQTIAAVARGDAGASALALAALQLRDALRGSAPYAAELQALRQLAGDDVALGQRLEPLSAYAESGLPSLAGLKAEFPAMAAAAIGAGRGLAEEGWVSGALRRVSELVSIRRVGMVEGDTADAVVARAEVKLAADDLAGAVAELDALQGPAAEAAAAWRGEAEARLAASRAVTELGALLAERALARDG